MNLYSNVGIVAVSGICLYLFSRALRRRKAARNPKKDDSRCACCLKSFLIGRGVECANCGARSCRQSCSHWNSIDETWSCLFCHHQRAQQEKKEISSVADNSTDFNPGGESSQIALTTTKTANSDVLSDPHDDSPSGSSEITPKEKVHEIIEKIVECLVGNVDDTPINRLYNHPAYDQLFNHHRVPLVEALLKMSESLQSFGGNKPAADAASMAHTALRELVERAVDEARKLPRLGDMAVTSTEEDLMLGEQRYEDLLATAILNKVIENYQKGHSDGDDNVQREKFQCTHVKIGQEIDNKDSTSFEACIECAKDRKFDAKDPIALKIEERIEEVTTLYTSSDDSENSKAHVFNFRKARCVPFPEFGVDIVDPSGESSEESEDDEDAKSHINHISPVESWEDNWLFQTKKIPIKSDPVVMLVPNPSSECRALIGNKDAEDTSDLSEFSAQSDDDGEDEILIEEIYDDLQPPHDFKDSAQLIHEEKFNSIPDVVDDDRSNVKMTRNTKNENQETQLSTANDFIHAEQPYVDKIKNNDESPKNLLDSRKVPPIVDSKELIKGSDFSKSGEVHDNGNLSETTGKLNEKSEEEIQPNVSERESEKTGTESCKEVNSITVRLKKSIRKSLGSIDEPKIPQDGAEVKEEENTTINDFLTNEKIVYDDNFNSTVNSDKKLEEISLPEDTQSKREVFVEENSEKIESDGFLNNKTMETAENQEKVPEDVSNSICREAEKSTETLPRGFLQRVDNESTLATPPRPGTIAEREHKKWENAPPLENNPYSEESIQKRLFQRRLTRISPDVSGNSTVLPTSPSAPLQIVLGAGRPDAKRFGRDYYINEVKIQTSERPGRSGASNSSRPSSSLSEHSNSTGSDFEPQEHFEAIEAASKSLELIQTNEFLERERKNSKNEINAKLNNQCNFGNTVTIYDGTNAFTIENNQQEIRRLDLRSYGFENEFNNNEVVEKRPQRIPNKLDLRSFGYDSGLRRTQSNNQIDSKVNNSFDQLKMKLKCKSNLQHDDYNWTKSSEALNDDVFDNFDKVKSAKSVPDMTKNAGGYLYNENRDDCESDDEKYFMSETENSPETCTTLMECKFSEGTLDNKLESADRKLPLPSVKKLAEAFDKPLKTSVASIKLSKSMKDSNKRPTTPDIHIVGTPRQMHSLTARSLSREFREGLKQIPTKSPQELSSFLVDQKIQGDYPESHSSHADTIDDINVIPLGKLKNNIQFWEQLQKKS